MILSPLYDECLIEIDIKYIDCRSDVSTGNLIKIGLNVKVSI